jgi:hypothetical protein
VGSINHDQYLTGYHVGNLNNGDQQSTVYSIGCWACNYELSTCIAEEFVLNTDGGAIAFIGNSRYGWFNPGNHNSLSNLYDRYFFRSLLDQGHANLGAAFSDHKNDRYPTDDTYRYIWTELTLLGDPELPIWTADPEQLVVECPPQFPIGGSDLTVHVERTGGGSISGALVCLWKGDEVYEIAYTGVSGDAILYPTPNTAGEMLVTVTNRNFVPYQGTVHVEEAGSSGIAANQAGPRVSCLRAVHSSPFSGATQIHYEIAGQTMVDLAIFDLAGRRLRRLVDAAQMDAGHYSAVWDGHDDAGRALPAGVYLYRLSTATGRDTRSVVMLR